MFHQQRTTVNLLNLSLPHSPLLCDLYAFGCSLCQRSCRCFPHRRSHQCPPPTPKSQAQQIFSPALGTLAFVKQDLRRGSGAALVALGLWQRHLTCVLGLKELITLMTLNILSTELAANQTGKDKEAERQTSTCLFPSPDRQPSDMSLYRDF